MYVGLYVCVCGL